MRPAGGVLGCEKKRADRHSYRRSGNTLYFEGLERRMLMAGVASGLDGPTLDDPDQKSICDETELCSSATPDTETNEEHLSDGDDRPPYSSIEHINVYAEVASFRMYEYEFQNLHLIDVIGAALQFDHFAIQGSVDYEQQRSKRGGLKLIFGLGAGLLVGGLLGTLIF